MTTVVPTWLHRRRIPSSLSFVLPPRCPGLKPVLRLEFHTHVAEPRVTSLCLEAQECMIAGRWFDLASLMLTSAELVFPKASDKDLECIFTIICNLVMKPESLKAWNPTGPIVPLEEGSSSGAAGIESGIESDDVDSSIFHHRRHLLCHKVAKESAKNQDRWLLVNLQSTREFSSHMLNRDTWANEAVSQTIMSNFIFWQVCDDTEDGSKIKTYYKLDSVPVTLVIDPVTGQKMRLWRGMIQPENLLEDLLQFMDGNPKNHHISFIISAYHTNVHEKTLRPHLPKSKPCQRKVILIFVMWFLVVVNGTSEEDEDVKVDTMKKSVEEPLKDLNDDIETEKKVPESEKRSYPVLPEEPKGDRNVVCRVGIRLPDGRRLQRNFLKSDSIQLLWSFCHLEGSDEKPFRLTHAIPGAVKDLDYDTKSTFGDSGIANSMISVTWE
ncbi:hypothetical protein LXL04_025399 [Taraxacum kok-saghyz]